MSIEVSEEKKPWRPNIETWCAVATLLGGLFVFGTGWEHRMTVVESAAQASSIQLKDHIIEEQRHDDKVDAERSAIWSSIRETNQLVRELSAKRK